MTKELLQQALTALTTAINQNQHDMLMTGEECRAGEDAISALEVAIAQPVQSQRASLTDKQIDEAWRSVDYRDNYEEFRMAVGRAIEAAQNIAQPAQPVGKDVDAQRRGDYEAGYNFGFDRGLSQPVQPANAVPQTPAGQLCEDEYGRGQVMWFSKPADGSMLYALPTSEEPVPTASVWRDISSAPKDQSSMLLIVDGAVEIGYYSSGDYYGRLGWRDEINHKDMPQDPTHWMPLPAPPTCE